MDEEHEWVEKQGLVTVVHLAVEYGSADSNVLSDAQTLLLQRATEADPPLLLLDLADTEYFGSEFIGVLVRCFKRIRERGGRFVLCNVTPSLLKELQIAHLDSLWPIYPTREEALQAIRGDGSV